MSIPAISAYAIPSIDDVQANRVNWSVQTERAVLLVHDMQNYFLRFYAPDSELIHTVVANIQALIRWARQHGVPVVYTAQPSLQSAQQRALLNDMWGPGLTVASAEQAQIHAALTPAASDLVLCKWRYSAFQRSELETTLRDWQRDQLLICGVYAHIGCMTTALDGFMRDIQCFMVADALADFSAADHLQALNFVATRCGAVTTSAACLKLGTRIASPIDFGDFKAAIYACLSDAQGEIDLDDNLLDYGLDSVQVMELLAAWQRAGVNLKFEQFARRTTLRAWWELLQMAQVKAA